MARRLVLHLKPDDVLMLREVAERRAVIASDARRGQWETIAREASNALTFEEMRRTGQKVER